VWGGEGHVGRIRNTVENITNVVAKVFGEYVPHCYGFELGLPWVESACICPAIVQPICTNFIQTFTLSRCILCVLDFQFFCF